MNNGPIGLTIEEVERLAAEVWDVAAKEALAKGLPVTGYHDGRLFRYHPGKGIEDLTAACLGADHPADDIGGDTCVRDAGAPGASCSDAVDAPVPADGAVAPCERGHDPAAAAAHETAASAPVPAGDPAAAPESLADFSARAIEFARQNANATLAFTARLVAAKTFAEVVALTTAHARKQLEAFSAQGKDLAEAAPVTQAPDTGVRRRQRQRGEGKAARQAPATP